MEFLIAGLLVLVLAVTLVNGQLLEREARRHFCEVKDLLAETNGHLMALSTEEARTEASLTAIWKTLQERKDLDKEDIFPLLARLKELLGEASSRGDEEARQSRAIEEGIANLLSYSVGKGREEPS